MRDPEGMRSRFYRHRRRLSTKPLGFLGYLFQDRGFRYKGAAGEKVRDPEDRLGWFFQGIPVFPF